MVLLKNKVKKTILSFYTNYTESDCIIPNISTRQVNCNQTGDGSPQNLFLKSKELTLVHSVSIQYDVARSTESRSIGSITVESVEDEKDEIFD